MGKILLHYPFPAQYFFRSSAYSFWKNGMIKWEINTKTSNFFGVFVFHYKKCCFLSPRILFY